MKTMKELFLEFAKKQGVTTKDVGAVVQVVAAGKVGKWISNIQPIEEERLLVINSILGIQVPEEKRAAIALLLTKLNYVVKVGAFQMNPENGEVAFRTTHFIFEGDDEAAEELVGKLTLMSFSVIDTYYEEIQNMA